MKTCTRCGVSKPLSDFGANRQLSDGKSIYCLDCARGMAKRWRDEHSAAAREMKRRWRESHVEQRRQYQREYMRGWRQVPEHQEQARAYARQHWQWQKHWRKAHGL